MAITVRRPAVTRRSQRVEHERDLVEGAIAMVSRGHARRISLVLSEGPTILAAAQASGRQWGVIVRAVWRSDGQRCDVVVEPIG
jgi:hypothetical protein